MIKPVSGRCNMRCSYCFYADEMRARQTQLYEMMTAETLEKTVRRAFAYADGTVSFAFQGGEPTLAGPDFYRTLLQLEKKYNGRHLPVHHALQTNGYELSDELLSVLREGDFLLGVSLDGIREIHDARRRDAHGQPTWDRITDNLQRIRAAGLEFNILCVVDRPVAEHAKQVFDALKPYRYLQFIPCLDALDGSTTDNSLTGPLYGAFLNTVYPEYERMLRNGQFISVREFDNRLQMLMGQMPEGCGYCGRCATNYVMESDGSLYPCDFYALDDWRLGDIRHLSFYGLEKSETQRRFLDRSVPVHGTCRSCEVYDICRGGCTRERDRGGVISANRLCEGYRDFFTRHLKDMQALADDLRTGRLRMPEG